MPFTLIPAGIADAETVALLVGELLNEIMDALGSKEFAFWKGQSVEAHRSHHTTAAVVSTHVGVL